MEAKSISEVVGKLNDNPTLKQKFLTDPMTFLESVNEKPIENKWVFLTIVAIVGLVLLASIVLGSIIIFRSPDMEKANVPQFLISIGSTALGALVGLLSPSPASK